MDENPAAHQPAAEAPPLAIGERAQTLSGLLPGEGLRILGWLFMLAAAGLLWWALSMETAVSIPSYSEALHDLDPVKYPLPSAVNNLGLLQKQLMILLSAGFSAVLGGLLLVGGTVTIAVRRAASVATEEEAP